jgi:hypothetical protein
MTTSTTGHSQRVREPNWKAATTKTIAETAAYSHTSMCETRPVGSGRDAVRGLRASISASMRRLAAMPKVRAETAMQ